MFELALLHFNVISNVIIFGRCCIVGLSEEYIINTAHTITISFITKIVIAKADTFLYNTLFHR